MTEKIPQNLDLSRPVSRIVENLGQEYSFEWETGVKKLVDEEVMMHGRDRDVVHLQVSGDWGKVLGHEYGLSRRMTEILSFALLIHDSQYQFVNGGSPSRAEIIKQKDTHGIKAYIKAREWQELGLIATNFSKGEWKIIEFMLENHDNIPLVGGLERTETKKSDPSKEGMLFLMFAADTIAIMDEVSGVKITFGPEELRSYLESSYLERVKILLGAKSEMNLDLRKDLEELSENFIKAAKVNQSIS